MYLQLAGEGEDDKQGEGGGELLAERAGSGTVPDANIIQLLLPADADEVIWKHKKYDLF